MGGPYKSLERMQLSIVPVVVETRHFIHLPIPYSSVLTDRLFDRNMLTHLTVCTSIPPATPTFITSGLCGQVSYLIKFLPHQKGPLCV